MPTRTSNLSDSDFSTQGDLAFSSTIEEQRGVSFSTESELIFPHSHPFQVGAYHNGIALRSSYEHPELGTIYTPSYNGQMVKAERDSSVRGRNGTGIEMVFPVLYGESGVQFVIAMLKFFKLWGARVNRSCGQHMHIGTESVTGRNANVNDVCMWLTRMIKMSNNLQYGAYCQTGTNRQSNYYSRELQNNDNVLSVMSDKEGKRSKRHGRGTSFTQQDVSNFRHSNRGTFLNLTRVGSGHTIEFRWAAGTLNPNKWLAHLFTNLFIAQRAWATKRYSNDCTKVRGNAIHRGDIATQGQRSLNYLVNDFRNTATGRELFTSYPTFRERYTRMWSIAHRMAKKWDRQRSGEDALYSFRKDPLTAMVEKVESYL